ncbi:CU044_5270 family protein [Nonomuraea guangzhouensis]|uniref:CU044_5270 family protein n=1 Tax=Nonomuraea guangzhouensis TaxID=1291555 RepID=A0ABW4GN71_9ACTN|nr:CU044_5270 family protein [Nonomuraea guangzhouensis]
MNDDHEEFAQALRTLAQREPVPPAPVSALVRRGRRTRRTRAVVGAIAGTALVSAAVVVVWGSGGFVPAGPPSIASVPLSGDGSRSSHSPRTQSLDARSVLLAAAETAAREPATSGPYWYTRQRTSQPVHYFGKKLKRPQRQKIPFSATVASTQDSWYASAKGAPSRTVTGQNPKVTFASSADEAKWKRLGSPALAEEKPSTNDYDMELHFQIGNHNFTVRQLLKLPTSKDRLESQLRRLFDEESASDWWPAKPEFTDYVWSAAHDLLAGPISPGTRSALYRLLAEQPAIKSLGEVTDSLGRTGVALAWATAGNGDAAGEARLIVDDDTAELLSYEFRDQGQSAPTLQVTYEDLGWAEALSERPQS